MVLNKQALLDGIKTEIERLMYEHPRCDFEHTWNCAIDKATECFEGY